MDFFSFEEDLLYHIDQAFVVVSSGLGTGFFQNPHVRDMLKRLNPRHRPMYPLKFLRLLRVICYVLNEEIMLLVKEAYLEYHSGFISSTSDFWWNPVTKASYGACIASMMANRYLMANGMSLYVSSTTLESIKGDLNILDSVSPVPKLTRGKILLDFVNFDDKKSGVNVGTWLSDIHGDLSIKPSYMGTHVVDGAADANSSVKELTVTLAGDSPREMTTAKCDSHQVNTSGRRASGTSSHVKNINPELGRSLQKLHSATGRITRSGTRQKVLQNVRNERKREKYARILHAVRTRWNSDAMETSSAASNQSDLSVAIERMVSASGEDKELYREHRNKLDDIIPTSHDWTLYCQYECGLNPLKVFSEFTQGAYVIVHMELFKSKVCLELLRRKYFEMFKNVSAVEPPVEDLTSRPLNQLVEHVDFTLEGDQRDKFEKVHVMEDAIVRARRIAYRQLSDRLLYKNRTTNKAEGLDLDADITEDLDAGLKDATCLNRMKIMGALLNPMFQSKKRMIAAGLCTESQYDAGEVELLELMTEFYARREGNDNVVVISLDATPNEWTDDDEDVEDLTSPARKMAEEEWRKFRRNYKNFDTLPEVEPVDVLGGYDSEGQPKPSPVLAIGPVKKRGKDLPSRRNHANYVGARGYYDLTNFMIDHKRELPALSNTFLGKLAPYGTSESDCESLFSESGHLAKPHMNRINVETFERMCLAKHRIARIYCDKEKVKQEFIRRWKGKLFGENEDRDDVEFWHQEKGIYLEEFPQHVATLEGIEADDSETETAESGEAAI